MAKRFVIRCAQSDRDQFLAGLLLTLTISLARPQAARADGAAPFITFDANGDGVQDWLVPEPSFSTGPQGAQVGRLRVVSGGNGLVLREIVGRHQTAYFGYAATAVGDINGDGFGDFAVSEPLHAHGDRSGSVHLVSGVTGGVLCTITPPLAHEMFGCTLAMVADTNGDGRPDLCVTSLFRDTERDLLQRRIFYSLSPCALIGADGADASTVVFLKADIDYDKVVAESDLVVLITNLATGGGTDRTKSDLNGDGVVDADDLQLLLLNFGRSYGDDALVLPGAAESPVLTAGPCTELTPWLCLNPLGSAPAPMGDTAGHWLDPLSPSGDLDGDGIINQFDPDADGDGIPDCLDDLVGPPDAGDGPIIITPIGEPWHTRPNDIVIVSARVVIGDANGNGTPDWNDPLSTGFDPWHPRSDADLDGVLNIADEDLDGDGVLDGKQRHRYLAMPFADPIGGSDPYEDDDHDGVPNWREDLNGNGDPTDDDTDGDGIPNYLDPDDDGDGIGTITEDPNGDGDPTNDDTDGDGIPDYLDTDPSPHAPIPEIPSPPISDPPPPPPPPPEGDPPPPECSIHIFGNAAYAAVDDLIPLRATGGLGPEDFHWSVSGPAAFVGSPNGPNATIRIMGVGPVNVVVDRRCRGSIFFYGVDLHPSISGPTVPNPRPGPHLPSTVAIMFADGDDDDRDGVVDSADADVSGEDDLAVYRTGSLLGPPEGQFTEPSWWVSYGGPIRLWYLPGSAGLPTGPSALPVGPAAETKRINGLLYTRLPSGLRVLGFPRTATMLVEAIDGTSAIDGAVISQGFSGTYHLQVGLVVRSGVFSMSKQVRLGCAQITPEEIAFNFDPRFHSTDGMNARTNASTPVAAPEWTAAAGAVFPAVYTMDQHVLVKARFESSPWITSATISAADDDEPAGAGALGALSAVPGTVLFPFPGGAADDPDTPLNERLFATFSPSGATPPGLCKRYDFWNWRVAGITVAGAEAGVTIPVEVGAGIGRTGPHLVYTLFAEPGAPWGQNEATLTTGPESGMNLILPRLDVLDRVLTLARPGPASSLAGSLDDWRTYVTNSYYARHPFLYDTMVGERYFTAVSRTRPLAVCTLETLIQTYNSPSEHAGCCFDAAASVVALSNLAGGEMLLLLSGGGTVSAEFGYLNVVRPIGREVCNHPFYSRVPKPTEPGVYADPMSDEDGDGSSGRTSFSYHSVAGYPDLGSYKVWDATLQAISVSAGDNPDTTAVYSLNGSARWTFASGSFLVAPAGSFVPGSLAGLEVVPSIRAGVAAGVTRPTCRTTIVSNTETILSFSVADPLQPDAGGDDHFAIFNPSRSVTTRPLTALTWEEYKGIVIDRMPIPSTPAPAPRRVLAR